MQPLTLQHMLHYGCSPVTAIYLTKERLQQNKSITTKLENKKAAVSAGKYTREAHHISLPCCKTKINRCYHRDFKET